MCELPATAPCSRYEDESRIVRSVLLPPSVVLVLLATVLIAVAAHRFRIRNGASIITFVNVSVWLGWL